ncbi:MAG TPA: outer membrane lipoprotein carrier protein LolA [Opitutaceae bacterium]|nr:outer membrane lipoprotein carrier protein LolA [Opitutaceae bacterium]
MKGPSFAKRVLKSVVSCALLAATLSILPLARAASASTGLPNPPENLLTSEHKIDPEHLGEPWSKLIGTLQEKGNISARFTENRYLPLKKIPIVFTGEIRLSADHGLSLHYLTPEDRLMVVDTKGVFMRNEAGRTREMPADPNALAATNALLQVMRFDLHSLAEHFSLYAAGDEHLWFFGFEPKDDSVSKTLSRLVVTGENEKVKRILMRKSALQSIEILIEEEHARVDFSPDELKRFFR